MNRRSFLKIVGTALLIPDVAFAGKTSKYMTVTATGYCPCARCCGRHANGITATGRSAWKAGVAVDPAVIPLGSHLDIPGYKRGPNKNGSWIKADDTGHQDHIVGTTIDVRFSSHKEAKEWGRKKIRVRVWT